VTARCSGCEQQRWLSAALAANGRCTRVTTRNSGSSTVIVPKVVCQPSFFTRPPRLGRLRRLLARALDAPLGPPVQYLAAQPPHFLNHAPLGLIGTRDIAVRDEVRERLDAPLESRMAIQHLKQLGIIAIRCVHGASSYFATVACSGILRRRISFGHTRDHVSVLGCC
jgi:hypothetical protein